MQIDVDLLKQFRETADWFMQLPEKLVGAVMGPKLNYLSRRERIIKSKELAELREIGKSIQELYFFKGNMVLYANTIQREKSIEDVDHIRDLFARAAEALDEIWSVMSETPISNMQLGAEAAQQIGNAKKIYETLRDLPDQAILDDRRLLDIFADLHEMAESGKRLLMNVDEYRRQIDATYGR